MNSLNVAIEAACRPFGPRLWPKALERAQTRRRPRLVPRAAGGRSYTCGFPRGQCRSESRQGWFGRAAAARVCGSRKYRLFHRYHAAKAADRTFADLPALDLLDRIKVNIAAGSGCFGGRRDGARARFRCDGPTAGPRSDDGVRASYSWVIWRRPARRPVFARRSVEAPVGATGGCRQGRSGALGLTTPAPKVAEGSPV